MRSCPFTSIFESAASPAQVLWLREQLDALSTAPEARLKSAFAAARRKCGNAVVSQGVHAAELPGRWTLDLLARGALLVAGMDHLTPEQQQTMAYSLYVRGELEERRAVLRALPYLPNGERHVALALEACRTNAKDMFEAISCENAFPAEHFDLLPFNQMVLKSLFMDLPSERIAGLAGRIGPALLRMVDDFDAELTAAGRPLPQGMAWIRARGEER